MIEQKLSGKGWFVVLVTLMFLTLSGGAAAESTCKGLSKSKCEAANCTWVNGYKRKDGIKVDGYCRGKSSKKVDKLKQKPKKKAPKKAKEKKSTEKKAKEKKSTEKKSK